MVFTHEKGDQFPAYKKLLDIQLLNEYLNYQKKMMFEHYNLDTKETEKLFEDVKESFINEYYQVIENMMKNDDRLYIRKNIFINLPDRLQRHFAKKYGRVINE